MAIKEIVVRHYGGYEETVLRQKPPVSVQDLNIFTASDGRTFLIVAYPREDSMLTYDVIYEVLPGKGYVCIGDGICGLPSSYPCDEIYERMEHPQWDEYDLAGNKIERMDCEEE